MEAIKAGIGHERYCFFKYTLLEVLNWRGKIYEAMNYAYEIGVLRYADKEEVAKLFEKAFNLLDEKVY